MVKDYLKKELTVGDHVVFCQSHGSNSGASLREGHIREFTTKMVRIDCTDGGV